MNKRLLFAATFLLAVCLMTCTPKISLNFPEEDFGKYLTPPGGVEIAPGLFYDRRETTVLNWREYLYWLKGVYGVKSSEFKAALPLTTVWETPYRCLKPMEKDYFSLNKYAIFPMVGVSRAQAVAYAKWRADRFMEVYLIAFGAITRHPDPGPRNHFTIQRYLSGKYRRFKPHPVVTHYIHYRLPDAADWEKARAHNKKVLIRYRDMCQEGCEEPVNAGQNPCVLEKAITLPVVSVNSGVIPDSLNYIKHLNGNVGEWSARPGVSLGGSWFDAPADVAQYALFRVDQPNAWTGIRLVAEYRTVEQY